MQITILINEETFNKMNEYKKKKYPHIKKVSRMMLNMVMDKVNEESESK